MKIPSLLSRALLVACAVLPGLIGVPAFSTVRPELPKINLPPGLQRPEDQDKPRPVTPDQVPPGALVPQGPPPELTVLATGDVVGYLEPCG